MNQICHEKQTPGHKSLYKIYDFFLVHKQIVLSRPMQLEINLCACVNRQRQMICHRKFVF